MNNFLMFWIKICQMRIEIVCQAKRGKIFLKIFLLFECKKVQFGPQNIIWGLKMGARGGRAAGPPPPGSATVLCIAMETTNHSTLIPNTASVYINVNILFYTVNVHVCTFSVRFFYLPSFWANPGILSTSYRVVFGNLISQRVNLHCLT